MLWDLAVIGNTSGWVVAFGIVLYVLRKVTRGDLVPRKTHEDVIEERNTWRTAAETKDDTISLQASQLHEYRVLTRSSTAILQAAQSAVSGAEASHGSNGG